MKTHLKTKIKHAVFALALQGAPKGLAAGNPPLQLDWIS